MNAKEDTDPKPNNELCDADVNPAPRESPRRSYNGPLTIALDSSSATDPVVVLANSPVFQAEVRAVFNPAWPLGFLTFNHALCLAACARSLPLYATAVEIGVYAGRSTYYFCCFAGSTVVHWGFDPAPQQVVTEVHMRVNSSVALAKTHFIRTTSEEAASVWLENRLDTQIDFLFIDGDHSLRGVMTDLLSWWPLLGPNALVVFHDLGHPKFPGVAETAHLYLRAGLLKPILQKDVCLVTRKAPSCMALTKNQ